MLHHVTSVILSQVFNQWARQWLVCKVESAWHRINGGVKHVVTAACLLQIFRLMLPHFRYTLPINAAARAQLVAADTVLEQCFTPGRYIMQLSSRIYQAGWQFKNEGLAADLRKR